MGRNICPGCGRCRECGQPTPVHPPFIPVYPKPYTEPGPEATPYREPFTITCTVDGSGIAQAILGR